MIPVTKPFLPPQEEYITYINDIWQRNWLTNNGPYVQELEEKLTSYLDVPHFLYVNNGTTALQLAIKALNLAGSIITTPFSFVATTSSIVWENCRPIFVDIDPHTYNIDPSKIAAAITKDTTAILATHVFGNPCAVEAIERIAKAHQLKVIYDAAHCFGVRYSEKSILEHGDISTLSFHATKLYHSTEGGGIVMSNPSIEQRIRALRNFGYQQSEINGLGINGKNSEFHAAMGLVNLNYVKNIMTKRRQQYKYYRNQLRGYPLQFQKITADTTYNYAYFPILFDTEEDLLTTVASLNQQAIYPRRYFYPALNQLPYLPPQTCPIAESIAKRILCLPLYHTLTHTEQTQIIDILRSSLKNKTIKRRDVTSNAELNTTKTITYKRVA